MSKTQQQNDIVDIIKWKQVSKKADDSKVKETLGFLPGEGDKVNLGFYTDRRSAHRLPLVY